MTSAMAARPRILSRPATFRLLVLEKLLSATLKLVLRIVLMNKVRRRHNKMGVVFKVVVQPPRCG